MWCLVGGRRRGEVGFRVSCRDLVYQEEGMSEDGGGGRRGYRSVSGVGC